MRRAERSDLAHVVELDARITGVSKPEYWEDVFERYSNRRVEERFFLVAEPRDETQENRVVGFIIGEVRTWEFGSAPCGWVFAFSVDPKTRLQRIGESLFAALSDEFRQVGIQTVRTMVARGNKLHMAFFRSEGMTAGPFIQLEKELD